jgi:hypothetical protein
MTPSVPPPLLDFLARGDPAASRTAGMVVFAVLLVALTARVLLRGAAPVPRPDTARRLDVAAVPLLIVFALVVLERFRDLA